MRLRRSASRDEMQGAHVVQPVGELDQQDADVAAHRQHELAEVLRLLGAVGLQFQPGQLGDAIDQAGDFLAEPRLDLRQLDRRVLDHVVQQAGGDRGGVEPVAGQDVGDRDRMAEIGIAVVAPLRAVRLHRPARRRRRSGRCRPWGRRRGFSRSARIGGSTPVAGAGRRSAAAWALTPSGGASGHAAGRAGRLAVAVPVVIFAAAMPGSATASRPPSSASMAASMSSGDSVSISSSRVARFLARR